MPRESYGAVSGPTAIFPSEHEAATYILAPQKPGFIHVPAGSETRGSTLSFALKSGEPVRQLVV